MTTTDFSSLRWTVRRKAAFISAMSFTPPRGIQEKLTANGVSFEEFENWKKRYQRGGKLSLRATHRSKV